MNETQSPSTWAPVPARMFFGFDEGQGEGQRDVSYGRECLGKIPAVGRQVHGAEPDDVFNQAHDNRLDKVQEPADSQA